MPDPLKERLPPPLRRGKQTDKHMILIKVDRFDDRSVSDGKSDPPARHIIGFRQGIDFDSRLFCAFGLQKLSGLCPSKPTAPYAKS